MFDTYFMYAHLILFSLKFAFDGFIFRNKLSNYDTSMCCIWQQRKALETFKISLMDINLYYKNSIQSDEWYHWSITLWLEIKADLGTLPLKYITLQPEIRASLGTLPLEYTILQPQIKAGLNTRVWNNGRFVYFTTEVYNTAAWNKGRYGTLPLEL